MRNLIESGRTSLTGWRHYYWPELETNLSHPPTDVPRTKEPFIRPTTPPLLQATARSTTKPTVIKQQAASTSQPDRPQKSDRPKHTESSSTDPPVLKKQSASKVVEPTRKDSISSSDSHLESASSDRPPVDIFVEEGELPDDQDVTLTDPDQFFSEEQTYRETGIRSCMGWTHSRHGH